MCLVIRYPHEYYVLWKETENSNNGSHHHRSHPQIRNSPKYLCNCRPLVNFPVLFKNKGRESFAILRTEDTLIAHYYRNNCVQMSSPYGVKYYKFNPLPFPPRHLQSQSPSSWLDSFAPPKITNWLAATSTTLNLSAGELPPDTLFAILCLLRSSHPCRLRSFSGNMKEERLLGGGVVGQNYYFNICQSVV